MATPEFLTNKGLDHSIVNGLEDVASKLNIPQSDLNALIQSALHEASLNTHRPHSPSVFRYSCDRVHNPLSEASISMDDPIIALGAEIFFSDE